MSCPNNSIQSGNIDTGEGEADATPCSDPADLFVEIDEGSDSESTNYGDGHTTAKYPGTDVTTGLQADACCVPTQTSAASAAVLDEVAHAYLLQAANEMVLCGENGAAASEEGKAQPGFGDACRDLEEQEGERIDRFFDGDDDDDDDDDDGFSRRRARRDLEDRLEDLLDSDASDEELKGIVAKSAATCSSRS